MPPIKSKRWVIADPIPSEPSEMLAMFPPFMRQILYNRGYTDSVQALRFLEGREEPAFQNSCAPL